MQAERACLAADLNEPSPTLHHQFGDDLALCPCPSPAGGHVRWCVSRFGHHLTTLGSAAILAGAALGLASCDSTSPSDTPRIALSATINGAPWAARTDEHGAPPYATWYPWDSTLALAGTRRFGEDSSVGLLIVLRPAAGTGTWTLAARGSGDYGAGFVGSGDFWGGSYHTHWYFTDVATTGTATIATFDTATHALAGTFQFTARDSLGAPWVVTAGEFAGRYVVTTPPDLRRP